MKRIAAYVRVSSQDQNDSLQREAIKAWGKGKDQIDFYVDKFTGRTMNRPAWNRLRLRFKRYHTVVVWKLDRLGRDVIGLLSLIEELERHGIALISLTEGVDPSTPSGRLFISLLASIACYEREIRGERQRAGIEVARQRNGGKCPWGGSKPGERRKVDPDRINELRDKGLKPEEIARSLGVSRSTVYNYLL